MLYGTLLALAVASAANAAGGGLTEPSIRAFAARQEAAWNGRDPHAFFASFTPDAVFVAQARNPRGGVIPNGTSTLTQATAQARRFFHKARFHETSTVDRIDIAADGRSARVFGREVSRIERPGQPARTLCAQRAQTLILVGGRIRSRGQTDTDVRCRDAGVR